MLSRSVKHLDGDLKGFLGSVEENSKLGVQTPVIEWSISNAEMGAQSPTEQLVSLGWIPGRHGMAHTSVETKKLEEKWRVAGKKHEMHNKYAHATNLR